MAYLGAYMKSLILKSALLFFCLLFVVLLFSHFSVNNNSDSADFSSRAPNAVPAKIWAVSAYLPTDLKQKVYLTFEGKQIKDISAAKPAVSYVMETETIVFPGLFDMHGHIKYNVLPLWRGGQGHYKNRFEWRAYGPYKDEVTGMMAAFAKAKNPSAGPNDICAAVRWAEMRALVGGTTSMQGIGNDGGCAANFGPKNVEIANELSLKPVKAVTDLVSPDYLKYYVNNILPEINAHVAKDGNLEGAGAQERMNGYYNEALNHKLAEAKIIEWFNVANQPRTLRTGLQLLVGQDFPEATDNSLETYKKLIPQISEVLKTKYSTTNGKSENDIAKQLANMELWLFDPKEGYFSLPPIAAAAGVSPYSGNAKKLFQKGGVISVDPKTRRYLLKFEIDTRQSYFDYMKSPAKQAAIYHLSEGMRSDAYNKSEYAYASQLGLIQSGLVMIHAVGLDPAMMADAAAKGASVVWSPTSNLLLYGETLDVVTARKKGLTVALGTDWGPSGTKSLLDELKIARQYLNKMKVPASSISDHDLVDMATINGAKVLNLHNIVGKVEKNYLANLLFVDKSVLGKNPDPYSALIGAAEKDVSLVVIDGEPLYGDQKQIEDAAGAFADTDKPNVINKCNLQKAMRFPFSSVLDVRLAQQGTNLKNVTAVESLLQSRFVSYKAVLTAANKVALAAKVPNLDTLYPCEDTAYQNYMNNFINITLPQYKAQREVLRQQYKLKSDFDPLRSATESEDEPE